MATLAPSFHLDIARFFGRSVHHNAVGAVGRGGFGQAGEGLSHPGCYRSCSLRLDQKKPTLPARNCKIDLEPLLVAKKEIARCLPALT